MPFGGKESTQTFQKPYPIDLASDVRPICERGRMPRGSGPPAGDTRECAEPLAATGGEGYSFERGDEPVEDLGFTLAAFLPDRAC
jgi:hypothetical protein